MRDHFHKGAWWYEHPEPPPVFREDIENLVKLSIRFDKLKQFFNPKNLATLERLKGRIQSFRDNCATFIADFDCQEQPLVEAIQSMMIEPEPLVFERSDIYDSRAWCVLPLSKFVSFKGTLLPVTPGRKETWEEQQGRDNNGDVIPMLHFGLRHMPWTVHRKQFKLVRRQEKYQRIGVMLFEDHRLHENFQREGRWVGQIEIPDGKKPKAVEHILFEQVLIECAKHYVRVEPDWTVRRLTEGDLALGGGEANLHIKVGQLGNLETDETPD